MSRRIDKRHSHPKFLHLNSHEQFESIKRKYSGRSSPVPPIIRYKAKREIKDAKNITMKNGKKAVQGVCPVCGTKIFRIGG